MNALERDFLSAVDFRLAVCPDEFSHRAATLLSTPQQRSFEPDQTTAATAHPDGREPSPPPSAPAPSRTTGADSDADAAAAVGCFAAVRLTRRSTSIASQDCPGSAARAAAAAAAAGSGARQATAQAASGRRRSREEGLAPAPAPAPASFVESSSSSSTVAAATAAAAGAAAAAAYSEVAVAPAATALEPGPEETASGIRPAEAAGAAEAAEAAEAAAGRGGDGGGGDGVGVGDLVASQICTVHDVTVQPAGAGAEAGFSGDGSAGIMDLQGGGGGPEAKAPAAVHCCSALSPAPAGPDRGEAQGAGHL